MITDRIGSLFGVASGFTSQAPMLANRRFNSRGFRAICHATF